MHKNNNIQSTKKLTELQLGNKQSLKQSAKFLAPILFFWLKDMNASAISSS